MDTVNHFSISYTVTSEAEAFLNTIRGDLSSLFLNSNIPTNFNLYLEYKKEITTTDLVSRIDYVQRVKRYLIFGDIPMFRVAHFLSNDKICNIFSLYPSFDQNHLESLKFHGKFPLHIPYLTLMRVYDQIERKDVYEYIKKIKNIIGTDLSLDTSKIVTRYKVNDNILENEI